MRLLFHHSVQQVGMGRDRYGKKKVTLCRKAKPYYEFDYRYDEKFK